ncbi:MAG: 2-succinyl-5-enolpyruvyl-6-hydroxy-3-cyclohexene-1-carboxylic-acid synthase [Pseudobdellovibrionaceae bacterium]
MSQNVQLSRATIETVLRLGVREFILCAGARNSPLVMQLEQTKGIRISSFFEERSAGFYALGRAQESERPVCVVTTSGTAVAELLPASIEATYTKTPLVWLTADRPRKYRGTGAPQTVSQPGIFTEYVEKSVDVEEIRELESSFNWEKTRPLHLNVCFDEPLLDGPFTLLDLPGDSLNNVPFASPLLNFDGSGFKDPFVILGGISESYAVAVKNLILKHQWIHYAEAPSQLRGDPELCHLQMQSGDKILFSAFREFSFQSLIRIGSVPTLRFWRDLEMEFKNIPVLNLSETVFSGLSRDTKVLELNQFLAWEKSRSLDQLMFFRQSQTQALLQKDRQTTSKLLSLFQEFPLSEPAAIYHFSTNLPQRSSIYLGNSLPIREWDLAANYETRPLRVGANRGANGIDGQISSFIGWCKPETSNFALIGDLTALYDLVGLWAGKERSNCSQRIVVINNGGGQIFKRIFGKDLFLNAHQLGFESWAKMWGWQYRKCLDSRNLKWTSQTTQEIIEVIPNAEQTAAFWQAWDQKEV